MSQMTYQVILSSDGKHTVIVTGDNQSEMQAANAWAKATYESIVERYGSKYEPKHPAPTQETVAAEETPVCAVHHLPMVKVVGKKGPFYSCHERVGEGWCDYRPPKD